MSQSLRITRLPLRQIARQHVGSQRRTFLAPTAIMRADLVQDLYLRELKNFKPTPTQPSAAESHVQKFSVPKPPPAPESIEIANDLKDYEQQSVEVEGQAASGEESVDEVSKFFENYGDEEEAEGHH